MLAFFKKMRPVLQLCMCVVLFPQQVYYFVIDTMHVLQPTGHVSNSSVCKPWPRRWLDVTA
jgi:hypothetical protein